MTKMILTRGIPASGKSDWAKAWVSAAPDSRVRVNRDNLRWTLGIKTGVGTYEQEQEVTHWQNEMIVRALKRDKDVVVDNTNLRAKNVKELLKIAKAHGAEVEFKDFHISRSEAILRDAARDRHVGFEVINNMWDRFLPKGVLPPIPVLEEGEAFDFKPYVPGPIRAMSFDVDGTLAQMVGRGPYDTSLYHTDDIDPYVREVLWLAAKAGYAIIILSGRSEDFKEVLLDWLMTHEIYPDAVFMRKSGDQRNDAIVKSELVDEHISGVYDVRMHFDDRNRVVDALRAKGIKVAQVQPGDF